MHQDVQEILFSEEQIATRVRELGAQITKDYQGKQLVVISVLTGAMPFTTDLIRRIDCDLVLDSMIASSYGAGTESSGVVAIKKDIKVDITGKDVLLVDDVVDSGRTLQLLANTMRDRGAASVKCCAMLDKPARRAVDFQAEYIGYSIPDAFVIGYGLDYAEKYRNLPYIGIIKPEAI